MRAYRHYLVYLMPFVFVMVALIITVFSKSTPTVSPMRQGRPFPMFYLPSLFDAHKDLTRDDLFDKVSIINIWASWCDACVNEHAALMTLKTRYGIPIYGIDFKDDPVSAKKWLHYAGNPYVDVGFDVNGTLTHQLGTYVIPVTFLIDPWGMIRYTHVGVLTQKVIDDELLPRVKKYTDEFQRS